MDFYLIALIGLLISFLLVFIIMPVFIKTLVLHNLNQEVSEYALEEYKKKAKTPIMGGLLFVIIPVIVYLAINFGHIRNREMLMIILSFISFCSVGFLDDIMIILRRDNSGLSPKAKLLMEFVYCLLIYALFHQDIATTVMIPFLSISIDFKWLYLPFMIMLYLAEANAVNFTDGMDGLCAGVSAIAIISFTGLSFIMKKYDVVIFLSCLLGGLFAYLCYNHYPARIFMGDSGSLALGGLFASLVVILNKEVALFFIGGVFVYEMFCVCLQLTSVKLFHRRIFSYTPIHYAFVLKGYKETKVVAGFYLLAFALAIIGFIIGVN